MLDSLFAVERLLWKCGADVWRRYIAEDAVIVLGEHEAVSRDDAIAFLERVDLHGHSWRDVRFNDLQCVNLDSDAAILTYTVRGSMARMSTGSAKCTSLYMRRDGRLRLAFHEHVAAAD